MDIKEKLNQYGRPLAVALIVIAAIVGISLASNDDNVDSDQNDDQAMTSEMQDNETASADEASDEAVNEEIGSEPMAGPVEVESTDATYKATAREGDNQTVMVRQIVSDYASDEGVTLNAEQRLYAETNLVNELGRNDVIDAGFVAELSKDTVAEIVTQAGELSEAEQDLWARYL